jgi:hypothetical protein
MKSISKKETQEDSPFIGFDKIYDAAIDCALNVVRLAYLSRDNSHDAGILFNKIEKNLLALKSNNHEIIK